ncbi:MAG: hypothetical protein JNL21_18035 [Myxococcales bacterium]|nr:hypothetical protein [Myxococcales bacterium]
MKRAAGLLLLLFCLAPTAGNIGSCGQEAVLLDEAKFFANKQYIDCSRCTECAIFTAQCDRACADIAVVGTFPEGCAPLVHDGEVCLDALQVASCDDYAGYVADEGATIPTECDFCPLDADGQPKRGDDE